MVDERLGTISGNFCEGLFERGAVEGDGIGVFGEQETEVESIWGGFIHGYGKFGPRAREGHCDC